MLSIPKTRGRQVDHCGATAMAAVTGASLAEVREAVRQDRADLGKFAKNGRHLPVGGLSDLEMIGAMHRLGWNIALSGRPLTPDRKMTKRNARKLCTLDEFAVEHGHDGPFVVCVTWHYVAIGVMTGPRST